MIRSSLGQHGKIALPSSKIPDCRCIHTPLDDGARATSGENHDHHRQGRRGQDTPVKSAGQGRSRRRSHHFARQRSDRETEPHPKTNVLGSLIEEVRAARARARAVTTEEIVARKHDSHRY
ncbi:hypothetical protein MES5069_30188 [Mesorhizobium escarrei]|uniref:Uncharacterized protein n=1 Tax=Mesorhizobium escarrei TaxID=666018 RepID=A0ABN8JW77_9HYPH|nr:hypothetical protein MES5069_30188 [Mesorhizobium escarrei]